jgi:hypothetical protein
MVTLMPSMGSMSSGIATFYLYAQSLGCAL